MAQTPSPGAGGRLDDLLLYRLSRLLAVGGSPVIRLCEGRFRITRREWRVLATLVEHGGEGLGSSQLAEVAQLDRARTSRAVGAMVRRPAVRRVLFCSRHAPSPLRTGLKERCMPHVNPGILRHSPCRLRLNSALDGA